MLHLGLGIHQLSFYRSSRGKLTLVFGAMEVVLLHWMIAAELCWHQVGVHFHFLLCWKSKETLSLLKRILGKTKINALNPLAMICCQA